MQDRAHGRHQTAETGAGAEPSQPAQSAPAPKAPAPDLDTLCHEEAAPPILPRAAGGGAGAVAAIVLLPPPPQPPLAPPGDGPADEGDAPTDAGAVSLDTPEPPAAALIPVPVHDEAAPAPAADASEADPWAALAARTPLAVPVFMPQTGPVPPAATPRREPKALTQLPESLRPRPASETLPSPSPATEPVTEPAPAASVEQSIPAPPPLVTEPIPTPPPALADESLAAAHEPAAAPAPPPPPPSAEDLPPLPAPPIAPSEPPLVIAAEAPAPEPLALDPPATPVPVAAEPIPLPPPEPAAELPPPESERTPSVTTDADIRDLLAPTPAPARAPFVRSEPRPLPRLDAPSDPATPLDPVTVPARPHESPAKRALRLAVLLGGGLALLFTVTVLCLIVLYRWVDPPASTLMLFQQATGTNIERRWVPLSRISPALQHAVIMSEDGKFCRHNGVDWGELAAALDNTMDGVPRGGSTISMQVVKNLFLWQSKSYVRKAIEIPLTFAIEGAWSKRRILEIYLNIAEWGPGIFGAEAAARYHFHKSAAALTSREAALLAVSLPNPFDRRAGDPGPGTQRLAELLSLRMRASPAASACVRGPNNGIPRVR